MIPSGKNSSNGDKETKTSLHSLYAAYGLKKNQYPSSANRKKSKIPIIYYLPTR